MAQSEHVTSSWEAGRKGLLSLLLWCYKGGGVGILVIMLPITRGKTRQVRKWSDDPFEWPNDPFDQMTHLNPWVWLCSYTVPPLTIMWAINAPCSRKIDLIDFCHLKSKDVFQMKHLLYSEEKEEFRNLQNTEEHLSYWTEVTLNLFLVYL